MKPNNREGSSLTSLLVILSSIITCAALGTGLPSIYALNFGIWLDDTCVAMIKANITSNCPTYEDIITLFPDTSKQDVSGKFGYYNGVYQRGPEKLHDSFEYYRFGSNNLIFIDPPVETANKIKLIEIKANLKEYLLRGVTKSYNAANHTLTMGTTRFIDSCRVAYIDAKDWPTLVGDSIYHMSQNCSEDSTKINTRITTQLNKTHHDISTTYKWKLAAWQKEMVIKCGKKVCLYEKDQPSPP